MLILRTACRVVLAVLVPCLLMAPGGLEADRALDPRPAAISPWVVAATAGGAQTDLIVVLDEQADLRAATHLATKVERGRAVHQLLQEICHRSQVRLRGWLEMRDIPHRPLCIVNAIHVLQADWQAVQRLAAQPEVARIEANPRVQNPLPPPARASVASLPASVEPNLLQVNADDVWRLGVTGRGVVVGGQDTGYQWDHPALRSHYRGWDGASPDHNYHWHDAIEGLPEPVDPHGHGTHTMGIIVGDDGAGNQIGVAPGAQWIGCRNMDSAGWGSPATYLECFEFLLAPYPLDGGPSDGNPDLAPDVTNNSWSCPPSEGCSWETLQAAVEAHRAAGILTVVSAGNEGPSCSTVAQPPALYAAAYTVGATDNSGVLASFSSRGPVTVDGSGRLKPDLAAPGVSVRSSVPGGGYGFKSGTSMAAPHAVGTAALVWSAVPSLTGQLTATTQILNGSALAISTTACSSAGVPNHLYGWGRLDAQAALTAAAGGVGTLDGRVTDAADPPTPVPGAGLDVVRDAAVRVQTESDADGRFRLDLLPGAYTVTVTAAGWVPLTVSGVHLAAGVTTTLPLVVAPRFVLWLPMVLRAGDP